MVVFPWQPEQRAADRPPRVLDEMALVLAVCAVSTARAQAEMALRFGQLAAFNWLNRLAAAGEKWVAECFGKLNASAGTSAGEPGFAYDKAQNAQQFKRTGVQRSAQWANVAYTRCSMCDVRYPICVMICYVSARGQLQYHSSFRPFVCLHMLKRVKFMV